MRVYCLDMPDELEQIRPWLERQLVGTDLGALAAELAAVHRGYGPSARNIREVLGAQADPVLAAGLSGVPQAIVQNLLAEPRLLLDLQELILSEGGEYWDDLLAQSGAIHHVVARGKARLDNWSNAIPAADRPSVSPSADRPSVSPSADRPSVSPSADRPSVSPSADRPSVSPSADRPSVSPSADRPSVSPSADRPSVSPSADRPSVSPSADRPSVSPSADRPSVSPSADRPSVSPSADRPSVSPSADRPSVGPSADRPSVGPSADRPSVGPSADRPSVGPSADRPTVSLPAKRHWYAHPLAVCLATAASLLLAVFLYERAEQRSVSGAALASKWGWARPDALPQNASPPEYLNQLADEAGEWFKRRPTAPADVARRILEFRQGCSVLMLARHAPLDSKDRDWLVERCRKWAVALDQEVADVEAGGNPLEVRGRADATIQKLIDALHEHAKQVSNIPRQRTLTAGIKDHAQVGMSFISSIGGSRVV